VSIKPLHDGALWKNLRGIASSREANVTLGLEEPTVTALILIKVGVDLPVVQVEDVATEETIGVVEAVAPELLEQVGMGVVGGPNLVLVLLDGVAVHAGEDEVLRTKELDPVLQVGDGLGGLIVEEDRAKGEKDARTRGIQAGDPVVAGTKVAPETAASDALVLGGQLSQVGLQRSLGDVDGEVVSLVTTALKDSEEALDLSEIAVGKRKMLAPGSLCMNNRHEIFASRPLGASTVLCGMNLHVMRYGRGKLNLSGKSAHS
jgi:hypothetical protein